jgi:hypothetical protein
LGCRLLSRWLAEQAKQGIIPLIAAVLVLIFFGMSIAMGIVTFLTYLLGGTLAGLLFAIPVYFGMPWYGLLPYGAGLGLLTYIVWNLSQRFAHPTAM